MEPKWLTAEYIKALHSESIAMFGGGDGVRDAGLLESALERPKNLHAYGERPTIHQLAAAYGFGIIKNHPFLDGNKRTGDLAIRAFLFRNGYLYEPDEAEEASTIIAVAAGELDEAGLADWIAANTVAADDMTDGETPG